MRVVFMGTPDFSVPTLTEIVSSGHEVVAVYTRAPKPAGRGQEERKSPVHLAAEGFGIPVFTPRSLKGEAEQIVFASHQADVAIVVAYGLLLPRPILEAPALGCLNLHGSLLPRWRGAAPIQRAIMAGDTQTGVMVMQMDEGLDTGPVAIGEVMPIGPDMTAGELHDTMMRTGADLMGRALAALERGSLDFTPQPETGAVYAKKIEKAEARIDWSRPAAEVHNHIRGLAPFPGAWFELELARKPVRIKALRSILAEGSGAPGTLLDGLTIACGSGAVRLTQLQREGKGAMDAATFLRGAGALPPTVR
ncbi:MAG: methionyl-tRNA formyltransferase [Alphaproteobacteria bacterium]|nr:methionyl-tRNA formyltransferase [Alphaproteobacteria bacterium]MBU1563000.1 methionyl-tRNA formyltransferase [Alphaproteobacteria bacterium]MBU2304195.1 methionyl-tRNA formyltransferase [Alphaproteobacteria bacterium]MBU2368195.1 methionyl-tRNA formyltransferase [Alphaproteobacteria bacterium]